VRIFQALLTVALCGLAGGCGDSSPAAPSAGGAGQTATVGFEGQWSGTTSQGRPISFTVSRDQKVTALTLGYNFGACSGSKTFSNLDLGIASGPNPATSLGPAFELDSGSPEDPNATRVFGAFGSSATASGFMVFFNYQGCGEFVSGLWSASKR
jgi:hypothetical protein